LRHAAALAKRVSVPAPALVPLPWATQPWLFLLPARRVTALEFHFKLPYGLGTAETRGLGIAHLGAYQFAWVGEGVVTVDATVQVRHHALHGVN
jgi:hypothetical protein